MIEINLLSKELKTGFKPEKIGIGLQPRRILYFIPLIFGILLCVHLYLLAATIFKSSQFNILNNKWQKFEPQRKMLEGFNKEYALLSEDALVSQQLLRERINWSEKLNKLSLDLPSGIWFNEVSISGKDFILRGSVVSLQLQEMNLIKIFLDNLKKDTLFFKDFSNLELGSVQRETIGGYDIVEFTMTANLNPR